MKLQDILMARAHKCVLVEMVSITLNISLHAQVWVG